MSTDLDELMEQRRHAERVWQAALAIYAAVATQDTMSERTAITYSEALVAKFEELYPECK